LLEGYALDWEYRTGGDTTWQRMRPTVREADRSRSTAQTFNYLCTYSIVDIDGVPGNPAGYLSGDPVIFDEKIHIDYSCTFDKPLTDRRNGARHRDRSGVHEVGDDLPHPPGLRPADGHDADDHHVDSRARRSPRNRSRRSRRRPLPWAAVRPRRCPAIRAT
jgi:hypothetical protein